MLNLNNSLFFKLLILFLIIQGCTPMSKITYLNDRKLDTLDISPIPPKHHLQIGDILMVKVISRNEESNEPVASAIAPAM